MLKPQAELLPPKLNKPQIKNKMVVMNTKFGFKIEACLTPITRDLLTSLVG